VHPGVSADHQFIASSIEKLYVGLLDNLAVKLFFDGKISNAGNLRPSRRSIDAAKFLNWSFHGETLPNFLDTVRPYIYPNLY
jgi:hypothetical protein